jgi:hypothetical protein
MANTNPSGQGENSTSPPQSHTAQQQALQQANQARVAAEQKAAEAAVEATKRATVAGNVVFGNASGPKTVRNPPPKPAGKKGR